MHFFLFATNSFFFLFTYGSVLHRALRVFKSMLAEWHLVRVVYGSVHSLTHLVHIFVT